MALNREERQKLDETHSLAQEARDMSRDVKTVLLGKNGDKGLVGEFKDQDKRLGKVEGKVSKIYGGIAVLGGLGIVTAVITLLVKLV